MTATIEKDYMGHSYDSIDDAFANALQKIGCQVPYDIIETRSIHRVGRSDYQIILTRRDES